jgi:flavin-dependent dehydrogenase
MPINRELSTQVAIIGGGPAGSAAATMLAKNGFKVVVLEQEVFPRFHIGESLLPNTNNFLKKLGVWEKIQQQNFVTKRGAQFMSPNKSHWVLNIFSQGLVKQMDMTYQVERSAFDKILLDHAAENQAEVYQGTRVAQIEKTSDGWQLRAENDDQQLTINCDWLIDASGRKCVVGRHLKLKREPLPIPGRLAVYNHFKNIPREACERGGDTLVVRLKDAWVWIIPLRENITSIGVVLQSGDAQLRAQNLETLFWNKLQESSVLIDLTKNAKAIDKFRTDSDYSYAYTEYTAPRTLLVGDAASFIDPVFSSGLCLALKSGILAAETLVAIRKNPRKQHKLLQKFTSKIKGDMNRMRKLIDMFYDLKGADILLTPRPVLKIPQAVNAILAGVLNPGWNVKWRLWIFEKIYAQHKKRALVPPIEWDQVTNKKNEIEITDKRMTG